MSMLLMELLLLIIDNFSVICIEYYDKFNMGGVLPPFVGRLWSLGKLARLTVCSDARCAVEGVCTSTDCRVGHWIQVSSVAVCYPRCVEGSSWDRNREIMCTAWYSWRPYKICK